MFDSLIRMIQRQNLGFKILLSIFIPSLLYAAAGAFFLGTDGAIRYYMSMFILMLVYTGIFQIPAIYRNRYAENIEYKYIISNLMSVLVFLILAFIGGATIKDKNDLVVILGIVFALIINGYLLKPKYIPIKKKSQRRSGVVLPTTTGNNTEI